MAMAIRGVFVAALLCFCCVELISSDFLSYDYGLCNAQTFAINSTFATNLNTVLSLLFTQASKSLFGNATKISDPNSTSDNCYGFFQCRGDLSLSDCSSCISSIVNAAVCPSAIGSRVMLEGCFLRYETSDFFPNPEHSFVTSQCSNSSTATASFQKNLASALNATAQAAPTAPGRYASTSRGSGDNTAYGLAQCLAYLTPSQCSTCLQVSDYSLVCPAAVAGATFYTSCYYRYSNVSFTATSSTTPSSSEPAASPPPNAIPPPAPSISPGGGRTNAPSSTGPSPAPSIIPSGGRTNAPPGNAHSKPIAVIVGAMVGVILFLTSCCCLVCWRVRRRRMWSSYEVPRDDVAALDNFPALKATKFSLAELRKATKNFDSRNKLGEGGFGPVYKGTLPNGKAVAVKMLSLKSHQGNTQFLNEVNLITSVQHRNLVELLGYCIGESMRIIVYEYLPNRSLDVHLFGEGEHNFLNWRKRYDILIGIARGLQYLHEDSHVKIVHRDIKASNILLDNDLNPKITDFGLARFFQQDVTHYTTRVAGTMGYLAPEYVLGHQLTEKVDVYSFGLVALEILTGRKIMEDQLEPEKRSLLEWAWALYEKRQHLQLLDSKLAGQGVNPGEVIRVVHVALLCTQATPRSRPAMSRVFAMLSGQSEILELPNRPLFIDMHDAQQPMESGLSFSSSS